MGLNNIFQWVHFISGKNVLLINLKQNINQNVLLFTTEICPVLPNALEMSDKLLKI